MFGLVKSVGLNIKRDNKLKLKNNQWRVALYFEKEIHGFFKYISDYHFCLQEKNYLGEKGWSSKVGYGGDIFFQDKIKKDAPYFNTEDNKIHNHHYYRKYIITNPNSPEK